MWPALKRLAGLAFLKVWRSHGGGLYSLGYFVTLLILEVQLVDEMFDASSVLGLIIGFVADFILRALQAFLWPLLLIGAVGLPVGVVCLALAYAGFEYLLRPYMERRFPELTEHDAEGGSDKEN